MNCWAHSLGDCDDKQSREHLVSASLWEGDSITVQGFPWCRDAPATIGLANLTSKVLCKRHNSLLSPLDSEAKSVFDVFRRATKLGNERRSIRQRKWKSVRFEI